MQQRIVKLFRQAIPYMVAYRYLLIGAGVLGIFGFAILRIDSVLQSESDQNKYNELLSSVKKVKFNEEAAQQIRSLEDTNASISGELAPDRNNPF